jgi:hypothetical protein
VSGSSRNSHEKARTTANVENIQRFTLMKLQLDSSLNVQQKPVAAIWVFGCAGWLLPKERFYLSPEPIYSGRIRRSFDGIQETVDCLRAVLTQSRIEPVEIKLSRDRLRYEFVDYHPLTPLRSSSITLKEII